MADLAVVILTYNEGRHIARAIASIAPIATQVFVVDSFSTDDTVALAEAAGATVVQHPFVTQAKQFNWALETLPISAGWILRLDADEVIEADLQATIAARLPALPADVVGVTFDRKHIFLGAWVRRGGRWPLRMLRLWRRGHGTVEDRWMDEHVVVSGGSDVHFAGGFADDNLNDLGFFTAKHNSYATREAIDALDQRLHFLPGRAEAALGSRQARVKRWVKERIYNRLPFQLSALGYFLYRYIVQLGFLDSREGRIYHVLQGFWYRYLVGAKTLELERAVQGLTDPAAIRARLSAVTGLPI